MAFRADLTEWHDANRRDFSWRDVDRSVYEVFVGEMLLRKTTAAAVEPIFEEFVERYPTIERLDEASVDDLAELLQPLGLHNKRARALKDIAADCTGGLPRSRDEFLDLPHVGPYIADATLCFGRDERRVVIDANVGRIFGRLLGRDFGSGHQLYGNDELREVVLEHLPESGYKEFNWALLDFGALICTARSPACEDCFARDYCAYYSDEVDDASK